MSNNLNQNYLLEGPGEIPVNRFGQRVAGAPANRHPFTVMDNNVNIVGSSSHYENKKENKKMKNVTGKGKSPYANKSLASVHGDSQKFYFQLSNTIF